MILASETSFRFKHNLKLLRVENLQKVANYSFENGIELMKKPNKLADYIRRHIAERQKLNVVVGVSANLSSISGLLELD